MSSLQICTLNCRGLQDHKKRKDVFKYLRERKASIFCIQDTHFTEDDDKFIRSQWGFEHYSSFGRRDSRGVSTLFNNNFEYKINKQTKDEYGNMIALSITVGNKLAITLINLYGRNRDSPAFYENLRNIIDDFSNDFAIICGDYNLVQDFEKDCFNYNNINNPRSRETLQKLKSDLNLIDPFRTYNPTKRSYTWQRKNPIKLARLDFFLISEELLSVVENISITPGYRTDHSMVKLEIRLNSIKKGQGFWKFNNSLLKDHTYVNKVKQIILDTKTEYSPMIVIRDSILDIPDEDLQLTIDDDLFLEMILMNIRKMTIPYCASKKRDKNKRKDILEKQIQNIKSQFDANPSGELCESLSELNTELEEIRKTELNGLLLRTRCKWIENGEKPTKYFLSLEKRNFVNKNISKLVNKDGNNIYLQNEILEEVKSYYCNLYHSRDHELDDIDLNTLLENIDVPKLTFEQQSILDADITKTEILNVLKNCKPDKSPGTDGFSSEFFKFFRKDLGTFIFRSFNQSCKVGYLSSTQKLGIISILPKGNKPREFLKNWRPISLLNTTYKLFSGNG